MRRVQVSKILAVSALISAAATGGALTGAAPARAQQDIAQFTANAINQIEGTAGSAQTRVDQPPARPRAAPTNAQARAASAPRRPARLPYQPRLRPARIAATVTDCGKEHVVGRGDTLSGIARKEYGDGDKWSLIFYANQRLIKNPSVIVLGWRLKLPCLNPPPAAPIVRARPAPQPAAQAPAPAPGPAEVASNLESLVAAATASSATAPGSTSDLQALVAAATGGQTNPAPQTAAPTTLPAGVSTSVARPRPMSLLTGNDFAPFTDQGIENGGLFTNIVAAALTQSDIDHEIVWVDAWSEHLDPLLTRKTHDMGFPWYQPDCQSAPDNSRCKNFFFSDPVFEVLVLLYSRSNNPVRFNRDSDVEGLTLCRPAGYSTFGLDQNGRNWLRDGKITLVRPQAVRECFEKLLAGDVDAVAMNEFTARQTIAQMNVGGRVVAADRALSLPALHLLVHKTHPRARVMMYQFNTALAAIRESGLYDEIVSRHLVRYWSEVEG